ncbi:transcription termination factor Rho [Corynebacterium pygosceleis]|uniref:Transcription termination factor Rho n=1 Tax=Corynebacterium pygosceleis TaxID=2800406 RepID=A0A9Q4C8S2_9CORY|nr:transcription termination factor Rho [Corynebacterium pygosceleis]MCK7637926.1 transcription termination factor Rho [Corynebacterium pygosceleis]MCK7675641.1 transcription termination factor Rho [Corynebacterium pygosceleis]MCX7468642.1 transcription termination factor Rho [Corynebacterium pygosceleis]
MTDTDNANKDLASFKLTELRQMAQKLGIRGISGKRKGDLIEAIRGAGGQNRAPVAAAPAVGQGEESPEASEGARRRRRVTTPTITPGDTTAESAEQGGNTPEQDARGQDDRARSRDTGRGDEASGDNGGDGDDDGHYESRAAARRARRNRARQQRKGGRDNNGDGSQQHDDDDGGRGGNRRNNGHDDRDGDNGNGRNNRRGNNDDRDSDNGNGRGGNRRDRNRGNGGNNDDRDSDNQGGNGNRRDRNRDDSDGGGRGNRRNRRNRRDRNRGNNDNHGHNHGNDDSRDDDVFSPVGGILDIVDNNLAFVRTTGYHAGPADVFVPQQMVRKFGLRAGDAITGQVKMRADGQPANQHSGGGRNRQKYNSLVRVDTVNQMSPEEARKRPDFYKLTPLYPNKRLRLETDPKILTTRLIDLIMPIGKGQRALIVSPPKAGKTTIMQNIANAIATNNPECHCMIVLVDERPEEVTDMQRSVKGEVIASTFDRPPSEHTAVAELAIERAKRLVEEGKDVVVLLDSITRLGRAYNNSSPASGRILSGGVDSNALYPPKRFLGAARNIEQGGSLTIIATAMVETGSAGDTVIFEEFKGTGNAELKLDRKISERRVFPAVDVNPSGTRKDELLLAPEEARLMHKLRRILSALDNQQAIDLLIKQLKKTKSNAEFMMQIASSAPMASDGEEEYS